jgi:HEAT repeat protein
LSVDDLEFGDSLEVQGQALEALGCIGDRRATAPVIELLSNPEYDDLQESGFRVLSQLDDISAQSFLLGQLSNANNRLARRRAVQALAELAETTMAGELSIDIITALINTLLDPEPTVRISAARALAVVDSPLVAVPLTLLLTDLDPEVRAQAAEILVGKRTPGVVDRLLQMLDGAEADLKVRIAGVLGKTGEPRAVPALTQMLATNDESLCYQAVSALGMLALPGPEIKLAAILTDQAVHANTRARAAAALGNIVSAARDIDRATEAVAPPLSQEADKGDAQEDVPDSEQTLKDAVFDAKDAVAFAALTALVKIMAPTAAAGFLVELLQSDTLPAGQELTQAAPAGQPEAGRPEEATTTMTGEPEAATVPGQLRDLVGEHSAENSTLAAILAGPKDGDPPVDNRELGVAGKPVPQVHSIKVLAASLLGGLGDPGSTVVNALIESLNRGDQRLTREALLALGRIGDPAALEPVLCCLAADSEDTRLAAIDALAGLGGGGGSEAAGKPLVTLLDDPQSVVRDCAVRALGATGGSLAAQHLPRMLDDEDRNVCRGAMAALTPTMASPKLSERMVGILFRFSADLRHDAAKAIKRLNDFDSTSRLLEILHDSDQEAVHWICIDALGEIYASNKTLAN